MGEQAPGDEGEDHGSGLQLRDNKYNAQVRKVFAESNLQGELEERKDAEQHLGRIQIDSLAVDEGAHSWSSRCLC